MSQQPTDLDADMGDTSADCAIRRFVRNRYFNGKVMSARDMQAEQEYHAERLEVVAGHVLGEGVVCGLEPTVKPHDGGLEVSVTEGVVLDCCGRPVAIEEIEKERFPESAVPESGDFSLFVEFEPCLSEKVTRRGSEDACGENCEYNRVVEDYRLRIASGPPAERKPVPDLEFPTVEEKRQMAAAPSPPTHRARSKPARSYHEANGSGSAIAACGTGGDPAVFLGYFTRENGSWQREAATEPRHYVYSNDMLYAAVLSHATDVGNPHDVLTSVDGVEHVDGNVDLTSTDDSVTIGGGQGRIDLTVGSPVTEEIDAIASYVRDKTLKYTIEAFYDVARTYADEDGVIARRINEQAVSIIKLARDSLNGGDFRDERAFAQRLREIGEVESEILQALALSRFGWSWTSNGPWIDWGAGDYQAVLEALRETADGAYPTAAEMEAGIGGGEGAEPVEAEMEFLAVTAAEPVAAAETSEALSPLATDRSFEDFQAAFTELAGRLPPTGQDWIGGSLPDGYPDRGDTTALAVYQDRVAEAARWLDVPANESEVIRLPGGHEVEGRIIADAIDAPRSAVARLQPGDRVEDREDESPDEAVVIKLAKERADEWIVYGNETVAYQNRNLPYGADEEVVLVTFTSLLDGSDWAHWEAADPEDLFYEVVARGIKFHAFPKSRLRRVQE